MRMIPAIMRSIRRSRSKCSSPTRGIRARLGSLTRDYKVLHGTGLIELGIRDCGAPRLSEPKIMAALAAPGKPPPAAVAGAQPILPPRFSAYAELEW